MVEPAVDAQPVTDALAAKALPRFRGLGWRRLLWLGHPVYLRAPMAARKKKPWNADKVLFPELQTGEAHVVKATEAKVMTTASTGLEMSPRHDARLPPLYVVDSGAWPIKLFNVSDDTGWRATELTARQVEDVARRRGLRIVPMFS